MANVQQTNPVVPETTVGFSTYLEPLLGENLSGYKSSKSCDVLVPGSKLTLLGITISWICNLTRTTQQLENSHAAWESGYSLANFPSQQEGSTCSGEDWAFPLFRQKGGSGPILALKLRVQPVIVCY
ncbi:hypothetical protein M8J77_021752 [Diaphorina citri]|nr:hypothetical protein M8J77_021752 [Diaphorina citri]